MHTAQYARHDRSRPHRGRVHQQVKPGGIKGWLKGLKRAWEREALRESRGHPWNGGPLPPWGMFP